MNILVTGDRGYIGSVLCRTLLEKGYDLCGFDADYYADCALSPCEPKYRRIIKDIRQVNAEDVKGADAVIHLAGLSNDPLGELAPDLTEEINFKSTLRLASIAKSVGVRRFIYSSSQSMYGVSNVDKELDEDLSEKNPVTVYARTKWDAECELKKLNAEKFLTVCFRPSTVFGVSPYLRCDIVYNNLVASAYTTGTIEIKSDGTPWRPVVHIKDVCEAFIAGLLAPAQLVSGQSFNVGIPQGNFSVRQLAEAAQRAVPGSTLVFTGEHGKDARTYQVSFKKILTVLKDYYKPQWNLDSGGRELVEFFKAIRFTEEDFRGRRTNRLKEIRYLLEEGRLDEKLLWRVNV